MSELAENFPPSVLDHILPFKGRKCDISRPVTIYRNLNDISGDRTFSVRQGAHVVGHTNKLVLENVRFRISKAGRMRCLRTKRRNVHAFMIGSIIKKKEYPSPSERVFYNPFESTKFKLIPSKREIDWVSKIMITSAGVYTCY